jgi:sulfide:quinone oxidoreductase
VFAAAQGRVVAHQIAAQVLGQPAGQTFDGAGYCFLETGTGRAVRAEGNFFALPHPVMQKRTPDEAQWRDKAAWIEGLLQPKR